MKEPIIAAVLVSLTNPLQKSKEVIKENILELTPIGTSMEDVLNTIENNKEWKVESVNQERGVSDASLGYPISVSGEKSIRAMIGEYHFQPQFDIYAFIKRSVVVFWAFDEDSKLVEVYVVKYAAGF